MERRAFVKLCATGMALCGGSLSLASKGQAKTDEGLSTAIECKDFAERAIRHFIEGARTCSESMLMAGCECLGIKADIIPDIALGFAGGIGFQGKTCGAVAGGVMVLSLAVAAKEEDYATKKTKTLGAVGRLYQALEKKLGTVECRILSGVDLTTEQGRKDMKEGVKKKTCVGVVETAAQLLSEELAKLG